MWIILASFFAMRHSNDRLSLTEDEVGLETWKLRTRKENVGFRAAAVKSKINNRMQQGLQVLTLKNLTAEMELFVNYGMRYWLKQSSIIDFYKNRINEEQRSAAA